MGTQTCDVFISYRRDGGSHLAQLVFKSLAERGYNAFMDERKLRSGKFGEAFYEQIEAAADFVPLLTRGCFAPRPSKSDWFRREIAHAIESGKNILPLRAEDFDFSELEDLPNDIAELTDYHCLTYHHGKCEESINKLCRSLASKRRHPPAPAHTPQPRDIRIIRKDHGVGYDTCEATFRMTEKHRVLFTRKGNIPYAKLELVLDGERVYEKKLYPPYIAFEQTVVEVEGVQGTLSIKWAVLGAVNLWVGNTMIF